MLGFNTSRDDYVFKYEIEAKSLRYSIKSGKIKFILSGDKIPDKFINPIIEDYEIERRKDKIIIRGYCHNVGVVGRVLRVRMLINNEEYVSDMKAVVSKGLNYVRASKFSDKEIEKLPDNWKYPIGHADMKFRRLGCSKY
jgi:hypothetical protein